MFLRDDLIKSEYVKGIKGFLIYIGAYKDFLDNEDQKQ